MAFIKHTQSEKHEVVSSEEEGVIKRHTKQGSVQKLGELERERLLKELEALDKTHNQ